MLILHEADGLSKDKQEAKVELFKILDDSFQTIKEKKEGTILLKGIGLSLIPYIDDQKQELSYKEFIYNFFFDFNAEYNDVLGFIKDQFSMMINAPTLTLIDEIEISLIDKNESDALAKITWMKITE